MLKKFSSYTFLLMGLIVLLNSCKKDYETIQSIDDRKIETYLSNNNVSATKDPKGTGFYYQITSPGTGEVYKNTDSVRYKVTVKSLLGNTVYYTTPETTNLGTLVGYSSQLLGINVKGMLTVLNQIGAGGSGRIILPSYLAYGKNGFTSLNIPSNEILDITVQTFTESQAELDDQHINTFMTANNLTAIKDPSGVYLIVSTVGTGDEPINLASSLTINYTGRTLDGSVFDSGTDATNVLGSFILGWEVLKNYRKGTVIRLLIPSVLAYGAAGSSSATGATIIPAHACLDFDIEITGVEN